MEIAEFLALSKTEETTIALIGAGLTNKVIAGMRGISEQTLKNEVTTILRKLGASNRAQAVAISRDRQLNPGDHHEVWQVGFEGGWQWAVAVVKRVNKNAGDPETFQRMILEAFLPKSGLVLVDKK